MEHKKATTIEEQIKKIQDKNIIILNVEFAKSVLSSVGYYRLGFYFFPFEKNYPNKIKRTHECRDGSTFEDVVALYEFDFRLRNLILDSILKIEVAFRTYLINTMSCKYVDCNTWYIDQNIMKDRYILDFKSKTYNDTFKKIPVIRDHINNYGKEFYPPAWKTLEFMTLGAIKILFENIKENEDRKEIFSHYDIKSLETFTNYLEVLRLLRNNCAHGGVIFDFNLPTSIKKKGPMGTFTDKERHNISGITRIIDHFLKYTHMGAFSNLRREIQDLILKYNDQKEVTNVIIQCTGIDTNGIK